MTAKPFKTGQWLRTTFDSGKVITGQVIRQWLDGDGWMVQIKASNGSVWEFADFEVEEE